MRKKRLLIDLSKSRHPCNGQGQFCILLGNELSKLRMDNCETTFLVDKKCGSVFPEQEHFRWMYAWHRIKVPRLLRRVMQWFNPEYDLWHVTAQDSEFWPLTDKTPVILTIHDLNFIIESKSERRRKRRLKRLQKKVDQARYITTISKFAATEIENHLQLRGKPIHVIYNGGLSPDTKVHPVKRPEYLPDDRFLFTIGTVKEKKNFHVLIPFLKQLENTRLVIAGNCETAYAQKIRDQMKQLGLEDRVILTGEISDSLRDWLYRHCQAFVFPSLAEGFGIPVIEAMSYGKPVFTSDKTSLPEVTSHFGFYFRSFAPEAMLKVFEEGMSHYAQDGKLAERIIQHSKKFSWKKSAQEYQGLYLTILGLNSDVKKGGKA